MPAALYPLSPLLDVPEATDESAAAPVVVPPALAPAAAPATPVPPVPGAVGPSIPTPPRPDTSRVQERYQAEIGAVKRRQAAFDTSEQKRFEREEGQIQAADKAAQAADDKLLADFAAGRQATQEEARKLPEWKPKPVVKAEDYQNFSTMLLGLGLIFGTVFRGGWTETAGMMNGAMQGYLDGSLEKAQKDYDDFQRKYNTQMDKVKAAQKDMEDVLYADNLTLAEKNRRMSTLAAIIGREDMRAAAGQRSIDNMMKLADASARAILTADTKYDSMVGSMNTAMARLRAAYGATDLLTDNAKKALNTLNEVTGGKSDIVKSLNSRWMRTAASPRFNELVEGIIQKNPGWTGVEVGRELAQNAVKYQGETAAFRQSLQREAGVARLTLAVQGMEDKVVAAAQQYGLYDQRWMNMPMNGLRDRLGDADYTRFHNLIVGVARQYMEAITMPGSNAQLHASSQDTADHMISDDMTLSQILGAFDAFNSEISSSGSALQTTVERLLDNIGAPGVKSLITYNGSMFAAPMTQDQVEAKFNESRVFGR